MGRSVAFVGTVGGIGTTRTVMDLGGLLARSGREVLLWDLDFATQGLGRHVEGPPGVDATALLSDPEADLDAAIRKWSVDGDGSLGVIPSLAPFVTIAKAKTEAAGARVEDRLDDATDRADWVLLDVPPVVSNQAIGAVTAAEDVLAVIPPTDRGIDALQRERGRLADIESGLDGVLAVGDGDPPPDADATIPALPSEAPAHRPATLAVGGAYAQAVAGAVAQLLDVEVTTVAERDGLLDRLRS